MKLTRLFIIPAIAAAAFSACEDGTNVVGESLVSDTVTVVRDSSFVLSARTLTGQEIQSRTTVQLLGRLDAKGYGDLRSDIVTQFMPAQYLDFTNVTEVEVDSVRLLMFVGKGEFTGDSLMPMGVNVYRLNRQLPSPIYNTFDPTGYYSPSDLLGKAVYTGNTLNSDSLSALNFQTISVSLDKSFGEALLQQYRDSTDIFYSPENFAEWFPGVYIANSFGSGRVTQIAETRVNLYYRAHTAYQTDTATVDSIVPKVASCLAVTPEVVTNNNLTYTLAQSLNERIARGEALLASPAGADVEITLPLQQMLEAFRNNGAPMSVLNSLSIQLPVEEIDADYNIAPPPSVLLVLKSKRDEFFEKNQVANSQTSFYANYNSSLKRYTFPDMRQYLVDMLGKEEITPEDYTFVLTPINIETQTSSSGYNTSSVITAMTPYITGPSLAKINIGEAKIIVVYSKQMIEI